MLQKFFAFTFILTLFFNFIQAQDQDSLPSLENTTEAAPKAHYVFFNGDSLLSINSNLGPYTPEERANAATRRLKDIEDNFRIRLDSFQLHEKNNYFIVSYASIPLLSISEADAQFSGMSQEQLAQEQYDTIVNAFSEVLEKDTILYWLLRILYTFLTLIGLFVIFYLVNRLFKWVNKKLVAYEKGLKRKRKSFFRYLAPRGPDYFFLFLSKVSKIALLAVILFFYLPLLFSFLPWTKGIVNRFYEYVSEPLSKVLLGLWSFISNNLIYIVIIYFVARYLLRIISYVSNEIEEEKLKLKGFHKDWARPTFNIIKIVIYAFTLVFMFPYLPGSDSKAFQGVSIFLGVLFSLGSTSAIANIVAGIVITYMRPFQIGDRVKIGDTVGDIVEKNLLVTRIKTVKNEDVTIPNANIINVHLWNYTKNASKLGIILHPTVTIGYDVPSEQVVELLLNAAKNTRNLTRDQKPFVLQKGLNDFYVEYELNVFTKQPGKMAHFYSDLNRNILQEFNNAGVEILSPHYSAYRDGNESTIPVQNQNEQDSPENPVTDVVNKITGKK